MAHLQKMTGLPLIRPQVWSSPRAAPFIRVNLPRQSIRQFYNKGSTLRNRYIVHQQYNGGPSGRPMGTGIVVASIMAVCCGVYGVQNHYRTEARGGSKRAYQFLSDFEKHMILSLRNIREGRYYTMITSTFTHIQPLHLVVNMVALWSFGTFAANCFGVRSFLVLWVGSGIACGAAQTYFWLKDGRTEGGAVGASGSICGLIGALTCRFPLSRVYLLFIPMPMIVSTLLSIGLSVAAIRESWLPGIGHAGHLGGLAFGAFWYFAALRRGKLPLRRRF